MLYIAALLSCVFYNIRWPNKRFVRSCLLCLSVDVNFVYNAKTKNSIERSFAILSFWFARRKLRERAHACRRAERRRSCFELSSIDTNGRRTVFETKRAAFWLRVNDCRRKIQMSKTLARG